MDHHALDLKELFKDHSVGCFTVACSLIIEHTAKMQLGIHRSAPTAAQLANRQRGAQLLHALTNRFALLDGSREFTLQVIDLAQGWSDTLGAQCLLADLLAFIASVYIYVNLHFTPGQVYPHTLPELLEAFEIQLGGAPHQTCITGRSDRPPRSFLATTTWI